MDKDRLLAELGEQSGDIALQCSDTAGFLGQLNRRVQSEAQRLSVLNANMGRLNENQRVTKYAAEELQSTAEAARDILSKGNMATSYSLDELSALVSGVTGLEDRLRQFLATIETMGGISRTLGNLAGQSQMLGLNAAIEAARGGAETKGFAVVANEMRRLAAEAEQSSIEVGKKLGQLDTSARSLIEAVHKNIGEGRKASGHVDTIKSVLTEMAALVHQFQNRSDAIADCTTRTDVEVFSLSAGLDDFDGLARTSAAQADEARLRLDQLESRSNDMLNLVAHGNVETRNSPFIALAKQGAGEASDLIERALEKGDLASATLFDVDYRLMPGTDPVQYDNGFADFADRHLRPVLDSRTADNPAIVGCCLVDINGYLPTHISPRSRPQRAGDPAWNLENSRNRQIFMDGQTRRALDGDDEFYLYTYRQDFGESRFRALRSVLVPLEFLGHRWGLYELGFLI